MRTSRLAATLASAAALGVVACFVWTVSTPGAPEPDPSLETAVARRHVAVPPGPAELAELARRFPAQKFLCAHAGGEWERGIRAVKDTPNVLIETSGFDATTGFIEMAVRELGARRIVFGSHLPSRSLGTELSKIVAADITEQDKRLILGENYRTLLRPILRTKRE